MTNEMPKAVDLNRLTDNITEIAELLRTGKLVVLRTDTIYGIVARADDEAAVRHLQKVRNREPGKAFIVLIANPEMAYGDDATKVRRAYDHFQPTRPTSVVITNSQAPEYLKHRDGSLAYRVPQVAALQRLLEVTGPIVAPSANPAGLAFSRSISDAHGYFGDQVAAYVDDGITPEDQQPSSVVQVEIDGTVTQIR